MKLDLLLDILQLWTVVVKEAGRGKSEVDAKPEGSTWFSLFFFFLAQSEALYATILVQLTSLNNLIDNISILKYPCSYLHILSSRLLSRSYLTAKAVEVGPTFLKSNITSDHLTPMKHNA